MSMEPPVHFCLECDLCPCVCDQGERIAELEAELATANEVIRQIAERFGVTDVRHILADLSEVKRNSISLDAFREVLDKAKSLQAENAALLSGKATLAKIMDRIHDALGLTGQSYQPHQLPGKVQKLMERLGRYEGAKP